MNVAELSTNVYQVAGMRSTNILQFRSYPGKASPLSEEVETRKFSEILADHMSHNTQTVSAVDAYSDMSVDALSSLKASLSDSELQSLRDSLNADDLSMDVVNTLVDDNGNIADSLLDTLLELSGEDEDENSSDSLVSGITSSDSLSKILTDRQVAGEYLSSASGRTLINELANNMIAGLVTGS